MLAEGRLSIRTMFMSWCVPCWGESRMWSLLYKLFEVSAAKVFEQCLFSGEDRVTIVAGRSRPVNELVVLQLAPLFLSLQVKLFGRDKPSDWVIDGMIILNDFVGLQLAPLFLSVQIRLFSKCEPSDWVIDGIIILLEC